MKDSVKRRHLMKSVGLVGIASVTGCVGQSDSSGSNSENNSDSGSGEMANSIEIWESTDAQVYDPYIRMYENQTGSQINRRNYTNENLTDRLQSRLLAGSGAPDLVLLEYNLVASFASTDGLENLENFGISSILSNQYASGVEESITYQDGIYAFPDDLGPAGVFYQNNLFENNGVNMEDIQTWDQFIQAGTELPDDTQMINIGNENLGQTWRLLNRQLGGQEFTENGEVSIDSEEGLRTTRLLKRMNDSGIVDSTATFTQEWFNGFATGSIGSIAFGAWFSSTLKDTLSDMSGEWRVLKMPAFEQGGNRASNLGGSGFAIPRQSTDAKKNRAWDFLVNMLGDEDTQTQLYEDQGHFPAMSTIYNAEVFSQPQDYFGGQRTGEIWTEVASNIPAYRYTSDTRQTTDIINTHMRQMFSNGQSPEAALRSTAEEVASRTNRELN